MKGVFRFALLLTCAFFVLVFFSHVGTAQPPASVGEEISASDLEAALRTLEDPKALEELKTRLRALLAAKQAAAPGPPRKQPAPFTRKIVLGIIHIEDAAVRLPSVTFAGLRHAGDGLRDLGKWVTDPKLRPELIAFVMKLAVALASAIAIFLFLRLLLRRLRQAAARLAVPWQGSISLVGLSIGAEVTPALVAYTFVAILVPWVGMSQAFARAAFMFTDYLMLYGVLAGILRGLLIPGDTVKSIFPVGESTAADLTRQGGQAVWFGVFGHFGLTLLRMYASGSAVTVAAGILYKLGWVAFVAMVLSHWRRSIVDRLRVPEAAPRGAGRWIGRLFNLAADRFYWAIVVYVVFLALSAILGPPQLFIWLVQRSVITVVLLLAGYGIHRLVTLGFKRAQRSEERLRSRYPELGQRVSRYLHLLQGLSLAVIWALFVGFILEAWGARAFDMLGGEVRGQIFQRVLMSAIVLALAMLFITIVSCVIERLMHPRPDPATGQVPEISQQRKTLLPLLNKGVQYVTLFLASLLILDQVGINLTAIFAGVGIVGLAVGFGAQTLVKDVISGFFLLFENQIRVGDVVVIGGKGGLVEAINLRTIVMRDLAGNVHIIPCGSVDKVMNMTKDYSRYVLDLGVSYREDVDKVMEVVEQIFEEMRRDPDFGPDILEPLEIFGVDEFGESQVTIKMRITTRPIKQWRVARELRRRIKKTFDQRGIEIPYPHRTIYIGHPKAASLEPLHVKLEREIESAFLAQHEEPGRKDEKEDPRT